MSQAASSGLFSAVVSCSNAFCQRPEREQLRTDRGALHLLAGELCVCDLAAACGQSESSVSHALRLLQAHRVVAVRREGRRAFYRLDDAHVRMLLDLALVHIDHAGGVRLAEGGERQP